jgi:citrate lyase beta subunit
MSESQSHPRRSLLFAPASRPDIFLKALASGADIVCVDLEDAVAPALKAGARPEAFAFLAAADQKGSGPERSVRLNPLRTLDGARDLAFLASQPPFFSGILTLTKVDSPEDVAVIDALLTEHGSALQLVPLIETTRGLEAVMEIATASPRIAFLLFGAVDLAAELGVPVLHEPLLYARSRVVHAAKRAGIGAFDVPCLDFRNLDLVKAESETAKQLGFTGKAVLHPSNIAPVQTVFTPSAKEIAEAEGIMAAYRASPTGLAVVDGKLIERPVVRAAERILARAATTSSAG